MEKSIRWRDFLKNSPCDPSTCKYVIGPSKCHRREPFSPFPIYIYPMSGGKGGLGYEPN